MTLLKEIWYWLCKYILIIIPDGYFYQLISLVNYKRLGSPWYLMNLKSPKTFNEKLNYIKIHERNPLAPQVADKVTARKYVSEIIGEEHLVPLIGVYKDVDAIDFDDLPNSFALKTNHGSGWNLICPDKNKIDWAKEKMKIRNWLAKNAYYLSREWQYKNIQPKIICEHLLGYNINDYKIFCTYGKASVIQVDSERFSNHQRTLFDLDWKPLDIRIRYPKIRLETARPQQLEEMIFIAEKLAESFRFCRVDLYVSNEKIYFGEITFHPGGGMEPFGSYEEDLKAGELIDIACE